MLARFKMKYEKLKQPNTECEYCLGYGILVRNNNYQEGYGEPYKPPTQKCFECNGCGWIVKEESK